MVYDKPSSTHDRDLAQTKTIHCVVDSGALINRTLLQQLLLKLGVCDDVLLYE